MSAGGLNKLPFGNMPRLLLAWVCTEVVRTQGRVLILGSSLSDFMRKLEIHPQSGGRNGVRTRLRNQMKRLFDCTVKLIYEDERGKATVNSLIARRKRTTNDRVPSGHSYAVVATAFHGGEVLGTAATEDEAS